MRRVVPFLAALAVAPVGLAQEPQREEDEIVITSQRPRGSVPGDIQPETTFSAADVRSYGASSVFQILAAIAPQTGTASVRGGGFPIVLLNGRRISGIQEIRDLPPDVISRVEIFDEQIALQYGFSPDQRVVNIVLERRFEASQIEAGGGVAAGDARALLRLDGGRTDIDGGDRFAASLGGDMASAITEAERGIAAPVSGPDARDARTLAPDSENWRANLSLSRALDERVTGNASLRAESSEQRARLGLDTAAQVRARDSQNQSLRAAAGLDGSHAGWLWTATATGEFSVQESVTADSISPSRTRAEQSLFDATANANGALLDLPAGQMRASVRLGAEQRRIDSFSADSTGERRGELERTTPSGRVGLIAPITSRRNEFGEAFGDVTVNATVSWAAPSDFTALSSVGYGGSWSPTRALRFSLQAEMSEAAPSLQQLGDPLLVTPAVSFFDPARGEDVLIARTSGGNAGLGAEQREDLIFNASWSPGQASNQGGSQGGGQGLTLSFSWARNLSRDAVVPLPTALAETEAAFPARYTRDLSGALVAIDARPVNLGERDIESLRWGVSFSRTIGERPRTPPSEAAPGAAPDAEADPGEQRPSPSPSPSPGGGARASAGRWSLSVFHRVRLRDEAILGVGQAPLDLLQRGGLDGGGEPPRAIEFEGGVFYRGLGARFNGGWLDGYSIPIASGGALDFSDRWTLNARLFVNFDRRPEILAWAPFLGGSRLALAIDNVTDSVVEVRDPAGATPSAYQEGYLNPLGRVVQLSFRKQF